MVVVEKLCKTRNDVYRLLLDNPGLQFYVQGIPQVLHVFDESLSTPFITIDADTGKESYKFHIKSSELNKLWKEKIC
jgi:hypothetical protein